MQFTSVAFIIFLAILIVVYYLLPKKCQWVVLLVASYIFYLFAGIRYLAFRSEEHTSELQSRI